MIRTLARRQWIAAVCLALSGASALAADPYPTKPIRIVVCTAPGGATDVTTRLVADPAASPQAARIRAGIFQGRTGS